MSAHSPQVLNILLERAAAERDAAALALQAALAQAAAARSQHGQLADYRQDYQQRWTQTFVRGASTMDIVGCYQSFSQRLDQAVSSQSQIAAHADQRVERARAAVTAAELRVASVRKLIERREAEQRQQHARQEQRAADEFAARVHRQRSHHAHPFA
jgi:flagellar FliJ protein